jgi:hypothetical protein
MTLKAGIVESEETPIAGQRLGKQVFAATDTQATIENLLGTMLSIRSVSRGYEKDKEDRSSQLSFETPASQDMSLGAEDSRDGTEVRN